MEKDFLNDAVHEIEMRIKEKYSKPFSNTYSFIQPIEEGTYCLIISKVGFIYYRNEMEKKFKKCIKYLEKHHPQYYFFTILTIDGEKRLIM